MQHSQFPSWGISQDFVKSYKLMFFFVWEQSQKPALSARKYECFLNNAWWGKKCTCSISFFDATVQETRKPCKGADSHRRQHARLWQFWEVQKSRDLDLDLGSGQGHISMHNTCRTTILPNHVTVFSRSTKIWPFEFREISTFGEVWNRVIAILEENSKIRLQQPVD